MGAKQRIKHFETEYDGEHLSYEERVTMLQPKQLIDELLFGRVILLDNENQVDDVLLAIKKHKEYAHKDDFTQVAKAKETNFDIDIWHLLSISLQIQTKLNMTTYIRKLSKKRK